MRDRLTLESRKSADVTSEVLVTDIRINFVQRI